MLPIILCFVVARQWSNLKLTASFRVTPPVAAFINKAMLGGRGGIVSAKPVISNGVNSHAAVSYYTGNPWLNITKFADLIRAGLRKGRFRAEDVLIQANSIRKQKNTSPGGEI